MDILQMLAGASLLLAATAALIGWRSGGKRFLAFLALAAPVYVVQAAGGSPELRWATIVVAFVCTIASLAYVGLLRKLRWEVVWLVGSAASLTLLYLFQDVAVGVRNTLSIVTVACTVLFLVTAVGSVIRDFRHYSPHVRR